MVDSVDCDRLPFCSRRRASTMSRDRVAWRRVRTELPSRERIDEDEGMKVRRVKWWRKVMKNGKVNSGRHEKRTKPVNYVWFHSHNHCVTPSSTSICIYCPIMRWSCLIWQLHHPPPLPPPLSMWLGCETNTHTLAERAFTALCKTHI